MSHTPGVHCLTEGEVGGCAVQLKAADVAEELRRLYFCSCLDIDPPFFPKQSRMLRSNTFCESSPVFVPFFNLGGTFLSVARKLQADSLHFFRSLGAGVGSSQKTELSSLLIVSVSGSYLACILGHGISL